jgi:hypothetical protein
MHPHHKTRHFLYTHNAIHPNLHTFSINALPLIVCTSINRKRKALGKTIIISSHIFSTLVEICDGICLLKEGMIIKKVLKIDFADLANEMRKFTIGNRIEKLGLI